jgi:hypothetical protein
MKKLFDKIKTFIDAWKIWLFFTALLVGSNGAQMYVHSEPEPTSEEPEKIVSTPSNLQKTIIIHKVDNEYCVKILNDHKTGVLH